ncbi:ABC transporter permease [Bacillus aquiflavi]|uniref:ABC transporter permease n=1 Tax=Bacillus aquiflavi TaxID=2672567 RepID=A0A6B3VW95_9BACI|nr:ABC transporter permease [Bacillus aquiflavi]MBA4535677.1 ABC transporter permease [Bacillus aquiflavi]NEY80053.1 ABC transporter permease [Bacillus aquiflavi]UAC48984.1 ABC transporter permease [Bacillus aquiflavi]
MFDEKILWKKRFGENSKEMGRYLRYILNGHLVIVMFFLLGTGAYYYQQWLETLSSQFPVELIMAGTLAVFLTYSPIYTFLIEPDQIFFLPLETKLSSYFQRSAIVSILFQSYILLFILAALMPMYVQVKGGSFKVFFIFLLFLIGMKALNIAVRMKILYYIEAYVHTSDMLVRFSINALFLYLLFVQASFAYLLILVGVFVLLYIYFSKRTETRGIKWESLIRQEEKRMTSFYRLANLFTDVPHLKERIKRRKWLDWLLYLISYRQDQTFAHLYTRTFLRAGDYFGLFIRLTIIGGAGLYFISFGIGQLFITLLFLYLTGFQLIPLKHHHQNKLWITLYPVSETVKGRTFNKLLFMILLIQSSLFTLVILSKGDWLIALMTFVASILFIVLFVFYYVTKKFHFES